MAPTDDVSAAEATPDQTVDYLVDVSKRPGFVPLRPEFLQRRDSARLIPGPLAYMVRAGDLRGLLLFLLLITKASKDPWDATLPSAVWARALGVALPNSKTARSTVSKAWLRLERLNLVERDREARLAKVTLRREDGQDKPYTAPGANGERYFKMPLTFWTGGPDESHRWCRVLTLPEIAVILIGRSLGDSFRLPFEQGPAWYGISADTLARGVEGLAKRNLLHVDKTYKTAPQSAVGYTSEQRYTLLAPFGPVGRRSGERVKKSTATKKAARRATTKKATRRR